MTRTKQSRALESGDRVFLREPTKRDRDELIERVLASGSLHGRWVNPPKTPEQYDDWLKRIREPTVQSFLVCRTEDGSIVGVFTLSQIFRRAFQNAYMSYYALEPFAGQGYMCEGLGLVLRHLFKVMKLHRVEANVQPGNHHSIKLVKEAGFRLEGFSPRYLKIAGRWRDHERWAITLEDWHSSQAR